MLDKKKLEKELEEEFKKFQKELGFKTTFEELEEEFSIKDHIYDVGYIRENFAMQMSMNIVDFFRNWMGYLNGLLMPNASFIPNQNEAKLFSSEKDKKEIWEILKIMMIYSNMYSLMFLKKDKKMQADFIDGAYKDWKNVVRPFIGKAMQRTYDGWKNE